MTGPIVRFAPSSRRLCWILGLSGTAEVLVVVGGSFGVSALVDQFAPYHLSRALGLVNGAAPDYISASVGLGSRLAIQFAALLALIAGFGWLRGRTSMYSYGLKAHLPLRSMAQQGLIAGLVLSVPVSMVSLLQEFAPIGRDTGWWFLVRSSDWDAGFWLFAAISCFVVVPVVNEFTWRGYVLGRLSEGFSPGSAILMTTALSAPVYLHLLALDAAYTLTFLALLVSNVTAGCMAMRGGSIHAVVLMHAIIALPLPGEFQIIRLAAGIAALSTFWPQIRNEISTWRTLFSVTDVKIVALVMGGLGMLIFIAQPSMLATLLVGGFLGLTALALILVKRSAWRRE